MRKRKRLFLTGYSLLGKNGEDGIRYTWSTGSQSHFIESAAFSNRTKIRVSEEDGEITAYTTSVSAGCILKSFGLECLFCRTGRLLPYAGILTPFEIAIQNITMVLADKECSDRPHLRQKKREFAYMGQGEPGFSYTQVRSAIRLTDWVLNKLNEKIYRHIIATCGIPEMIDALCWDLKHGFFGTTRITMHFSLHANVHREYIMPIETLYPHSEVIRRLALLREISGEKPCIGILLFNNFKPKDSEYFYTNDRKNLEDIANLLNPSCHRISLCEYNVSSEIGINEYISQEHAEDLLCFYLERGFDAKLFASFGSKEDTACGLLAGIKPKKEVGRTLKSHYERATKLVFEAARSCEMLI